MPTELPGPQFNRKFRKIIYSTFASDAPTKHWCPLRPYRMIAPAAGPEPRWLSRYGGRSAVWIPEDSWFDSAPRVGNYAPQSAQTGSGNNPAFHRIYNGILSLAAKRPRREADHLAPLLPILMVGAIPTPTPCPSAFTECTEADLLLSQLIYTTVKDRVPIPRIKIQLLV